MFFLLYNVVSNVMRIIVNIYVLVFILNCQQVCFYQGAFVCPTWTSATNLLIFVLWSTDCKDSVKYYYGKVLSLFFNNKSEKMLYELQVPRSGFLTLRRFRRDYICISNAQYYELGARRNLWCEILEF